MCIYKRHMQACVPCVTSTCVYFFGRICVCIMSMHVYLHFAVDDRLQSCRRHLLVYLPQVCVYTDFFVYMWLCILRMYTHICMCMYYIIFTRLYACMGWLRLVGFLKL